MKQENKNVRQKVGAAPIDKLIRRAIGKTKNLDTEYYQSQVGKDRRVVWIVDRDNDIQNWLDMGAEHIPESKSTKKGESSSVRVFAGTDNTGRQEWQYALSVPNDVYDRILEIKQEEARKPVEQMRQRAMAGQDNETNIQGVSTYAPELPSGGMGISES